MRLEILLVYFSFKQNIWHQVHKGYDLTVEVNTHVLLRWMQLRVNITQVALHFLFDFFLK